MRARLPISLTVLLLICGVAMLGTWGGEKYPTSPARTGIYNMTMQDANHAADPAYYNFCTDVVTDSALATRRWCYIPSGSTFTLTHFSLVYFGGLALTGATHQCALSVETVTPADMVAYNAGTVLTTSTISVGDEGSNTNCVNQAAGFVFDAQHEECTTQPRAVITGPLYWRVSATDNGIGAGGCDAMNMFHAVAIGTWSRY